MDYVVSNLLYGHMEKPVLKNVSFLANMGDIVALLGPNGSGKTTTLKCLAGINTFYEGNIEAIPSIDDFDCHDTLMLFDTPALYDELTGKEHIDLIIKLSKKTVDEEGVSYLLKTIRLENAYTNLVSTYSLGMKKKLYLIMGLIQRPKVLLLDEYISGLDPHSLMVVKKILVDYCKEGNIIIISTHMLDAVEKFCNRVVMINDGITSQPKGTVEEIVESYGDLEKYYIEHNLDKN